MSSNLSEKTGSNERTRAWQELYENDSPHNNRLSSFEPHVGSVTILSRSSKRKKNLRSAQRISHFSMQSDNQSFKN